jgi:broad specificity phosphatase PhoE
VATTVFLLRHAAHERLDRILRGRMVRYRTRRRRAAAGRCRYGTDALETSKAVYSSTLQRMQETAAHSGVSPIIRDGLTEIEYCARTNRSFASLSVAIRTGAAGIKRALRHIRLGARAWWRCGIAPRHASRRCASATRTAASRSLATAISSRLS